jgi:single-strand DNA-binding protein
MNYTAIGKIAIIGELKQVTATFQKRILVLEIPNGKYTEMVQFEFTQDRAALLDVYTPGQNVQVDFNLRGREHNGNFYVTLNACRIIYS